MRVKILGSPVPFESFVAAVTRYDRTALLRLIADISAKMGDQSMLEATSGGRVLIVSLPALSRIAVVSIAYTPPRRSRAPTETDLLQMVSMWGRLDDEFRLGTTLDDMNPFLIRTSFDQFPLQVHSLTVFGRWSLIYRVGAEVAEMSADLLDVWQRTFSLPPHQWFGGALYLHMLTLLLKGTFSLGSLRTGIDNIRRSGGEHLVALEYVPTVLQDLAASPQQLADDYHRVKPKDTANERYAFNPLMSRPYVEVSNNQYVCPVPKAITNAVGMGTVYRLSETDPQFMSKFGHIFEGYVGALLRDKFGDRVHPEPVYKVGKEEWRGFDWTVLDENVSLMVECRSTRPSVHLRHTGDREAAIKESQEMFAETAGKMPTKLAHLSEKLTPIDLAGLCADPIHLVVQADDVFLQPLYLHLSEFDPAESAVPLLLDISALESLLSLDNPLIVTAASDYRSRYRKYASGDMGSFLSSSEYKSGLKRNALVEAELEAMAPEAMARK